MNSLKILIPTDFSVHAEFAYLIVKKMEENTIVDVHFLHVLAVPDTVSMDLNGAIQTCGEIDVNYLVKQKEIAERKLANLKIIYGSDINTHLVLGKITDAIINFSEENKFDLIVMGTKGASGLKEKLTGSETQIIARKSKVPLLSLMCDRSDLNIQNILLVHNFNQPINEDLQLLHKLIKAFKTKVHLLQIISEKEEDEKDLIIANMKTFVALNTINNFEFYLVKDKDVENGVIHFNQKAAMDIVCIGTHGRGGLFHHSVTEKLINHLNKPIISFHLN